MILFGVSIGTLGGLIIGAGEGYLVRLSLIILLRNLLEYPHPGAVLPVTILGVSLGVWFGSGGVSYWCYFHHLMDYQESTCGGNMHFLHTSLWSSFHI